MEWKKRHCTFRSIIKLFKDTGPVHPRQLQKTRFVTDENVTLNVLANVSQTNIRDIAREPELA